MKLRKEICALTFLIALLFLFCACTDTAKIEAAQKKTAAVLAYLKDAREDMKSVHTVLYDKDLNLSDIDASGSGSGDDGGNEELEPDIMQKLIEKIAAFKKDIRKRIANVKEKDTDVAALSSFSESELRCMQLLDDVLTEYEQICNYLELLLVVGEEANTLKLSGDDLAATYQGVSDTIDSILSKLNGTPPPSFLQAYHEDTVGLFAELKDASGYLILATANTDPLKINAGGYRFNIIFRNIDEATASMNKDIERRLGKIKQDADALMKMDKGLTGWLDDNIERLNDMEGGKADE